MGSAVVYLFDNYLLICHNYANRIWEQETRRLSGCRVFSYHWKIVKHKSMRIARRYFMLPKSRHSQSILDGLYGTLKT